MFSASPLFNSGNTYFKFSLLLVPVLFPRKIDRLFIFIKILKNVAL
jgi:hypothetical protein